MIRFTAIRLVEIAALLLLLSFVIYGLIGLMPGDPIDLMRSADPRVSAADVARLKAVYGLDRPLVERYFAWLGAGAAGRARLFPRCSPRRSGRRCCRGSATRCC